MVAVFPNRVDTTSLFDPTDAVRPTARRRKEQSRPMKKSPIRMPDGKNSPLSKAGREIRLCLAAVSLLFASGCAALLAEGATGTLQGFEYSLKRGLDIGLTKKGLEDLALVTLRAKLPRIRIRDRINDFLDSPIGTPFPRFYSPYIYLSVVATGSAAYVVVELRYLPPVVKPPWGKKRMTLRATLWSHRVLLEGPKSFVRQRIQKQIEGSITAFAADWYKANPRK